MDIEEQSTNTDQTNNAESNRESKNELNGLNYDSDSNDDYWFIWKSMI